MNNLPIGQNRPTSTTQQWEHKLASFKVNELQSLLQSFKVQKIGKKNELYTRCIEILRTPTMTANVIEKIREIEARVHQRPAPYPLPTMNNNFQQQQQQNMYQRGMYGNVYGGMPGINQMAGGMGMHQNVNVHAMTNITPRPARNLTAMPLPFYDPSHTLLEPQELPCSVNVNNKMNATMYCQFTLMPEQHMKLSTSETQFPRTEVQLRFFNTTGDILHIEQADDFPLNCAVKLNDSPVSLPNVIPTNKPNVEPKRPSRPVNITQWVINQPRDKVHRMKVEWQADKRQWAVAVYLVNRVNAEILKNRIVKSPSNDLPYETTEATIRKRLGGGDDDDVAMDSLKISLLCPLMKTRMSIAARSRDCTHLQCFDLDSYLMLNEKKPSWKCGVCNNLAPYHRLIIDKYFMKMLKDLGPMVTDVELLKDGSFRVIKEDDVCDITDDEEDSPKPKAVVGVCSASGSRPSSTTGGGAAASAAGGAAKKNDADDIITISDDEECQDDVDLHNAIRASMPGGATDTPQQHRTPKKASPSSDDSIIVLDDTPPRSEPSRSSAPSSSSSANAASSSSWRVPSSSPSGVATSSSGAVGVATSSSYGNQPRQLNLADALSQATGIRPGQPGQLQLNTAPLSAAAMAAGQQSIYNWQHQQQPQSAPPMMTQQQQQQQQQ
ncbi:hypothetical protein PMAYCL1PPCAC_23112, partial [Pristionchus mayeri]